MPADNQNKKFDIAVAVVMAFTSIMICVVVYVSWNMTAKSSGSASITTGLAERAKDDTPRPLATSDQKTVPEEAQPSTPEASPLNPPEPAAPAEEDAAWVSADIGTYETVAGSASFDEDSRTMKVQGGGRDAYGKTDSFFFVYKLIKGDFELVARVASLTETHRHAKAGLMARFDDRPGAVHVMIAQKPESITQQRRLGLNQVATAADLEDITPPKWLRLIRKDHLFTGFYSADGENWTEVAKDNINGSPAAIMVGFAVCSHDVTKLSAAVFEDVQIIQPPRL